MIKSNIRKIKETNPKDYKILLIAAHEYIENKNSADPDEFVERNMLAVVTDILDKYGIKYENDLC